MASSSWKVWERTCSKVFSRWLSGAIDKESPRVEEERVVCRQSLMGRMVERKYGDLATHPDCSDAMRPRADWFMKTFMVDAKKRAAFRLPGLLTSPDHEFWKWWEKLSEDAGAQGKRRFMVLLDHNSKARVLAFGRAESKFFNDQLGFMRSFPFFNMSHRINTLPDGDREEMTFCDFDKFLKWADPVLLGCPEEKPNELPVQTS